MRDLDFTFLTADQVVKLGILKKCGMNCEITGFASLLGQHFYDDSASSKQMALAKFGSWWLMPTKEWGASDKHQYLRSKCVCGNGEIDKSFTSSHWRDVGARPAVPYSAIKSLAKNEVVNEDGVKEVEYGEYPQTIVGTSLQQELEECFKNKKGIRKTGKVYITDSIVDPTWYDNFKPRKHEEFEYKGKKYIRVVADTRFLWHKGTHYFPDGREIKDKEAYWIEVEPIKWLVDEEANIALSKKVLFAGVTLQRIARKYTVFDKCDMKIYMNKYFAKEIIPSKKSDKVEFVYPPTDNANKLRIRRKAKRVNRKRVRLNLGELNKLSYELLKLPEDHPEKADLEARFKWLLDYYTNNYELIESSAESILEYREEVNDFTLKLYAAINLYEKERQKGDFRM